MFKIQPAHYPLSRSEHEALNSEWLFLENARRVLPVLHANDIYAVTMSFDSREDQGGIYHIDYDCPSQDTRNLTVITHSPRYETTENGHTRLTFTEDIFPLEQSLRAIAYDYLVSTGIDWRKEHGSLGTIHISAETNTIGIDITTRTTQYHPALSEIRPIE